MTETNAADRDDTRSRQIIHDMVKKLIDDAMDNTLRAMGLMAVVIDQEHRLSALMTLGREFINMGVMNIALTSSTAARSASKNDAEFAKHVAAIREEMLRYAGKKFDEAVARDVADAKQNEASQ